MVLSFFDGIRALFDGDKAKSSKHSPWTTPNSINISRFSRLTSQKSNETKESTEISLQSVLKTLVNDEDLSDLQLEGKDGVQVFANRAILAARSDVFRKMLYGNFKESQSSVIKIGKYPGAVLRAIVQYCYTDDSDMLHYECNDAYRAKQLVFLVDAAEYFDLGELREQVEQVAMQITEEKPALACAFLRESRLIGPSAFQVGGHAWSEIQSQPLETLLLEGADKNLMTLPFSVVQEILEDSKMSADELTLFRVLQAWARGKEESEEVGGGEGRSKSRHDSAKDLVRLIQLANIDPVDLSTTVKSSGLVSRDGLLKAYESQALSIENKCRFNKPRYTPTIVWSKSQSDIFCREESTTVDMLTKLQCKPMRSGIHRWRVNVLVEKCPYTACIGLGVLQSDSTKGWFLTTDGKRWSPGNNSSRDGPPLCRYTEGDILTFTLDLRDAWNLSVAVNDGTITQIFSGMRDVCDSPQEGLVPFAGLFDNCSVRFLGFE